MLIQPVRPDRSSIFLAGLGLTNATTRPSAVTSSSAPATGVVYGTSLGARAGDIVTNIGVQVVTAGAGTTPTLVRFGTADSTGKILAVTADVHASAGLTTQGIQTFALTAPLTISTSGLYYLVMLQVGSWGTTQMQLGRTSSGSGVGVGVSGGAFVSFAWTGQADLPAVNSSVTVANNGSNITFFLAYN